MVCIITLNKEFFMQRTYVLDQYQSFIKRKWVSLILTFFLLALSIGVSVSIGSYNLSIIDVYSIIIKGIVSTSDTPIDLIIWNNRLPRIMMAVGAGVGLGIAGAVMQAILKNPLASPFTLGIASAASFGASLAIILGAGIIGGSLLIVCNAFIFTLVASFIIYILASLKGFTSGVMIMAGIAVMYLFSALTTFIQYMGSADAVQQVVFWTMGSLGKSTWNTVIIVFSVLIITIPWFMYRSFDLNILGSGDELAVSMGVHVRRIRAIGMALTSFITAGIISFTGTIGFIGLIAPHMSRSVIGGDHRFLIPLSGLIGAIILVLADAASRIILAPQVIPVGVMTAFLGVPFFIFLFMKQKGDIW